MVAQFITRKGHCHLLAAVPTILRQHPDVRFILFGKGPLEQDVRVQIAHQGLSAHILLAGFREDLETLLPCLYALVHPAEREGLGVSLLQAAACGVPMVATAVGGIPEIVREGVNGHLVPAGNPDALARALLKLLDAPKEAHALGERGRALVEAEFSIETMVQGNLQIYQELLESIKATTGHRERR
jgi:glycosyltransferase involved in cell wall biosynthesis